MCICGSIWVYMHWYAYMYMYMCLYVYVFYARHVYVIGFVIILVPNFRLVLCEF